MPSDGAFGLCPPRSAGSAPPLSPYATAFPAPRELRRGRRRGLPYDDLRVVVGAGPGPAWRAVSDLAPRELPAEGYVLRVNAGLDGPQAIVAGADARGAQYGLQMLAALATAGPHPTIDELVARDWPELLWRGTIEGFYGPPWTHQDRLDHLRFAGAHRLNTYVYAPKDDPFHRERWRDLYPVDELALLGELVTAAQVAHVRFVVAISPGLSMRYSDDAEHHRLAAKAAQLQKIGVQEFALAFDDIPTQLQHDEDVAVFGGGPGSAGAAHGRTCARFAASVLAPAGLPLVVVPTDYAGGETSPYRDRLAADLPADALVWWTGVDIVVGEVCRADIDSAAASYQRDLLLWDNFPVNDFARSRLFLGPLQGRTGDVAGSALRGISANPMIEAAPSQLSLASVAEWAWNPESYDPAAAARRALVSVAGPLASALSPLVQVCSSWPPSAPQSPLFDRLTAQALAGGRSGRSELRSALHELADARKRVDAARSGATAAPLAQQLLPWVDAGAAVANAALAAVALLDLARSGAARDLIEVLHARTTLALAHSESLYPDVLRGCLPAFVRAALELTGPARRRDEDRSPQALIVSGVERTAGDDALDELLGSSGLRVRRTAGRDPVALVGSEVVRLVVVTGGARVECARAAAGLASPLLACAHLVALDLARESGTATGQDTVVGTGDPLATLRLPPAAIAVYRGPGSLTWGDPGEDAVVAARTLEGSPAVFGYAPQSRLVSGTRTDFARTVCYLGRDGMAPWLTTDAGRTLLAAIVTATLAS